MQIAKEQMEEIVRLIISREEHYVWNASRRADGESPLTPDHVFGEHVLVMKERKVPLLPRSKAHQEQRVRAIAASTMEALYGKDPGQAAS